MKSIADLKVIRQETLAKIVGSKDTIGDTRVVVGMATCGIAAGAQPVMAAFIDEVVKRKLQHVTISQTGCIGMCRLEPMVDVLLPGKEKVTYVKLKPDMVPRIVLEHIVHGNPVTEYSIRATEGK